MAELREQIAGLAVEERLDLAALIAHLNRADDPEYQSTLDQRAADICLHYLLLVVVSRLDA
ncbi:MAG TPA: hypothetical protein VH619_16110 [Verrucomicrobiae bacterium]|nr:hypothetical protein [Verrucomicrobiae bacterium]